MTTAVNANETTAIADAKRLPSGARFFKCALQVNPHHYSGSFRGQQGEGDSADYVNAIIEKASELGISALAITDHNSVSDIAEFRSAAANRDITILPGFELASTEGIHILCIYPPDTEVGQLERYLGEFGIRKLESSSDLSSAPFEDVLQTVREQEGIAVAAHITTNKGLLEVLSGLAAVKAWRDENLLAVQIPDSIEDLPDGHKSIVENKDPNYERPQPAGNDLAIAVVNAKDIAKPDDLEDPSATCWIKMSEISIEGLRQAFLDPDSRIRLNTDSLPEDHAELVSLEWKGGFLDGAAIHFNPNLNVLVGGRGAGKSTIIESLRYALDLEPLGDEAKRSHNSMVDQVLRSGTKITLTVRSYHPSESNYRIERTVPNPPIVRDDSGRTSSFLPRDILPDAEIYGQHEISELAKSPEKLTSILKRFVQDDGDESLTQRKHSLRRGLASSRQSIIGVDSDMRQIEDRLAKLPSLQETLKRYQDAGVEDRLMERSLLVREERILDSIPERTQPFREGLEMLRQGLPIDRAFLSSKSLEELPGRDILADADGVLERLSADFENIARQIEESLERADADISQIRSRWDERKARVESAYQKVLRELQKSSVDGAEFIRLRQEIEKLLPLRERQSKLDDLTKEYAAQRRALLVDWEEAKAEEFRLLARAAKRVGRKLRYRVQVEVTSAGDLEPLFNLLRNEIRGRLAESIDAIGDAPNFSLTQFVQHCNKGAKALQEAYAIPSGQAKRLAAASPETLMSIEELELPPTTQILRNTAPAGEDPVWKDLDSLSTGQKATAVLLLLLLESDAPLIVDQPEDDLDNRFITEGIVPKMREEKRRRQFIFSTHNANIPVLGDAELVLGLAASGDAEGGSARIKPRYMGSIDARPVRELIEEILEGGKDAFKTRRLKYGF